MALLPVDFTYVMAAAAQRRRIAVLLLVLRHIHKPWRSISIFVSSEQRLFMFHQFSRSMSLKRFERAFRLSKSTFGSLCKCVEKKRIESNSNPQVRIPIEVGIAMTLRYLAGGSYIDIALAYFVSVSTLYFVTEEALRVIDN
jgi:hypothetical protein